MDHKCDDLLYVVSGLSIRFREKVNQEGERAKQMDVCTLHEFVAHILQELLINQIILDFIKNHLVLRLVKGTLKLSSYLVSFLGAKSTLCEETSIQFEEVDVLYHKIEIMIHLDRMVLFQNQGHSS